MSMFYKCDHCGNNITDESTMTVVERRYRYKDSVGQMQNGKEMLHLCPECFSKLKELLRLAK